MKKKLAVVLSGGGLRGAFQVGVLDQLIREHRVQFDLFVGTSTGAIQATGAAMNDMEGLLRYWESLKSDRNIYWNKLEAFFFNLGLLLANKKPRGPLLSLESLFDLTPLRRKLHDFVDADKIRAAGKELRIVVAGLQSGEALTVRPAPVSNDKDGKILATVQNQDAVTIIEQDTPLADWVAVSCAEPPAFAPIWASLGNRRNEQWIDGGIRDVTPLGMAMEERPDRILIVRASPDPGPKAQTKRYRNLIGIGLRCVDILRSEVSINDFERAQEINDFCKAVEQLEGNLSGLGIPDDKLAEAVAPLRTVMNDAKLVPMRVLRPKEHEVPKDPHKFVKEEIEEAIRAGRACVEANWMAGEKLQDFLTGGEEGDLSQQVAA